MTDYQGLGTPGTHTYMDRVDQVHAVLDIARVTQTLALTDITPSSPVGVQGYSQGGGAAAAAGELAPTYAPELALKGAAVGAVPADLVQVGKNLDGGLNVAFELYATAGVLASQHIEPASLLNSAGLTKLRAIENECVLQLFNSSGLKTSTLTNDGRSISDHFADEPYKTALAENRIGNRAPKVPVLMVHSTMDDTIPYKVGVQLNKYWCNKGASVNFRPSLVPTHAGGIVPFNAAALGRWDGRFAGIKQINTCGAWR